MEVINLNYIKEHVSVYMAREGRTRKDIAEELGMPIQTFYAKLSGNSEFTFTEACRLAKILGCKVDRLTMPLS